MQEKRIKKQKKAKEAKPKSLVFRKIAVSLTAVVLIVSVLLTTVYTLGLDYMLPLIGNPAEAYHIDGEVRAMLLDPLTYGSTYDHETYYRDSVSKAKENGINTIIFRAKNDVTVYWRDNIFPVAPSVEQNDTKMGKQDPLMILCDEAKDSGIQIWVMVSPYANSGEYGGEQGQVSKLVQKLGSSAVPGFSPDDKEYNKLLVASLSRLPHKYPLAGVVFADLEKEQNINANIGWNTHFIEAVNSVYTFWQKQGITTKMALNFAGDENSCISLEDVSGIVSAGVVEYLLPKIAPGKNYSGALSSWDALGGKTVIIPQAQGETDTEGFAVPEDAQILFSSLMSTFSGSVIARYPALLEDSSNISFLRSASKKSQERVLPQGFEISQELNVTYPANGFETTLSSLFVSGTSSLNSPLMLNGKEIGRRGENGVFGVLVDLEDGENDLLFSQDGKSVSVTINKVKPEGGGSTTFPDDDTKEAEEGQTVRILPVIASALEKHSDANSINATLRRGAVLVVEESFKTLYNGKNSWVYKTTSGSYVWAAQCEWIESAAASFTGLTAIEEAKGETISFMGSGTPAVFDSVQDGVLVLRMYDTSFTLDGGFSSKFATSAEVIKGEKYTELRLKLTDEVWGYSIEYVDNTTALYIKQRPTISANLEKPLENVTIMIDPGHGGDEPGALGLLGQTGPIEKEINFILAQTIAYRLEQLGATVIMTRNGDDTLSLADRVESQYAHRPDFFLSVHHNSVEPNVDATDSKGVLALYHSKYSVPNSASFASSLTNSVALATGRSIRDPWESNYYVTRSTICPAVLFEYGFMVSPEEFADITSLNGIYLAACASAAAVYDSLL